MKTLLIVTITVAILAGVAWLRYELREQQRANAYYCGYLRGIQYAAEQLKAELRSLPAVVLACEAYDDLDRGMP